MRVLPAGRAGARALAAGRRFAKLAADNLDLSKPILASIGSPCGSSRPSSAGRSTPLDQFAVGVAATLSLMLVTLLLAAGMLAMEREEGVFARLVRGLVSRSTLLAEKVVLAAAAAFVVTLIQLAIIRIFVSLEDRAAGARALGALAFAALGAALGRAGARGAGGVAAGDPALAAAGVPRAGALRRRRRRPLRRPQRDLGSVPVQADAAGARRRDARALHLVLLAAVYGAISRLALRRF